MFYIKRDSILIMNKIYIIGIIFSIFLLSLIIIPRDEKYTNLSPDEFKTLISDESVHVIDVHIPEQEHIEGTDAFIPYNNIESFSDQLPKDKNTKIAIYCRTGSMSIIASEKLIEMGYENVYNLIGGKVAYGQ